MTVGKRDIALPVQLHPIAELAAVAIVRILHRLDAVAVGQAKGLFEAPVPQDEMGGDRDFSIPRRRQPDYATLDLAASYRLTQQWTLFGRIENVTDTTYQSPDGFLRPGIGAYGGIKVSF